MHEWFWCALHDGQHQLVMKLAPSDFDWRSVHDVHGTPLMALVHERILLNGGLSEERPLDDMIRFCMRMGADPRCVCQHAVGVSVGSLPPDPPGHGWERYRDGDSMWWHYEGPLGKFWCVDDDEKHIREYEYSSNARSHMAGRLDIQAERHAGHSAISLTIAIKQKLLVSGESALVKRADNLLSLFAEFATEHCGPKMQISQAVVQMWARVLEDKKNADVELFIDSAPEVQLLAHSHVLCNASPVLRALLESDFQEGSTRRIAVPDVGLPALQLLLMIIYTGCSEDTESPVFTKLEALDLAHRWQLEHIVLALERLLVEYVRMSLGSHQAQQQIDILQELIDAAKLKDLKLLGGACHDYLRRAPEEVEHSFHHKDSSAADARACSMNAKRLRVL